MSAWKRVGSGLVSLAFLGSIAFGQNEERKQRHGRPGGQGGHKPPIMQKLEEIDADGDGKLSRDEWLELFLKLDGDGDELLTVQEVLSGLMGRRGRGQMGERLKKMDADGDGAISREEFQGPPQIFDRLDKDADGRISKDEMAAIGSRGGQGGKGRVPWDKDGDGKVSREEFRGPAEMFDKADADADGLLTMEELKKLKESRRRAEQ